MAVLTTLGIKIDADLSGFSKKMDGLTSKLKNTGEQLKGVGKSMTKNVTAPIVAIGTASAAVAGRFETSLTKINTQVGISKEQVGKWKDEIKKLAPVVGVGPVALSDALFVVASAGADAEEALGIVEVSAKASAIGLGDTETVARAVTAAMTTYADSNLTAEQATDKLLATVKAGNLAADELAPTLGKVIPIAASMGISFDEVGANIATFTRLGVSASESTTALKATLSALQKPSKAAEEAAYGLGTSFEQIRRSVRENGLASTMNDLITLTDGNSTTLSELIPSVEGLASVLGTAGAQGEEYEQILRDIQSSTGLVDKGFKEVSETSEQKMKKSMAALAVVGVSIGDNLLPILSRAADFVTNLANRFENLSPETQRLAVVVAAVAAAMGPLAVGIGSVMAVMSPLVLAIGAVVAAGAALILNWDEIRSWAETNFPEIVAGITTAFGVLVSTFELVWNNITTVFKTAFTVISNLFAFWYNIFSLDFSGAWENVKNIFGGVWQGIKDMFANYLNAIKDLMPGFLKDWLGMTDEVAGGTGVVEDALVDLEETTTTTTNTLTGSAGLAEGFEKVTTAANDTTAAVEGSVSILNGLETQISKIPPLNRELMESAQKVEVAFGEANTVVERTTNVMGKVETSFKGVGDVALRTTTSVEDLGEETEVSASLMNYSFSQMAYGLKESFGAGGIGGVMDQLKGNLGSIGKRLLTMATDNIPGLGTALMVAGGAMKLFGIDANKVMDGVKNTIGKVGKAIADIFTGGKKARERADAIKSFTDQIAGMGLDLSNLGMTGKAGIRSAMTPFLTSGVASSEDLLGALGLTMGDLGISLADSLGRMFTDLSDNSGFQTDLQRAAAAVFDGTLAEVTTDFGKSFNEVINQWAGMFGVSVSDINAMVQTWTASAAGGAGSGLVVDPDGELIGGDGLSKVGMDLTDSFGGQTVNVILDGQTIASATLPHMAAELEVRGTSY